MNLDRLSRAIAAFLERHRHGQVPNGPRQRRMTPEGRRVAYELARGSSDLIGIIAPSGRFVALEVKTPDGRVTEHKARFLDRQRQHGGIAGVVWSVDDARAVMAQARKETPNG